MSEFMTTRQTAKSQNLPEHFIRSLIKARKCPGFYQGTRFYINVPMLMEMLHSESAAAVDWEAKS